MATKQVFPKAVSPRTSYGPGTKRGRVRLGGKRYEYKGRGDRADPHVKVPIPGYVKNPNLVPQPQNRNDPRINKLGSKIFLWSHVLTNRVVYSFTPVMDNADAIKQLTFVGKKSVPRALRKDMWRSFARVEFQLEEDGLLAFHHLREYRKMHETRWDRVNFQLDRKARTRVLMDQKANSVADLAATLSRNSIAAEITWQNLLDAEYAKEWPDNIQHNTPSRAIETMLKNVSFGEANPVISPATGKEMKRKDGSPITVDQVVLDEDARPIFDAEGQPFFKNAVVLDAKRNAFIMEDGHPMLRSDVERDEDGRPMFGLDGVPLRKMTKREKREYLEQRARELAAMPLQPVPTAREEAEAEAWRTTRRTSESRFGSEGAKEYVTIDTTATDVTPKKPPAAREKDDKRRPPSPPKPRSTFGSFMSRIFSAREKL